ncbi:Haloacetate dehalogenase H-1 [Roseovarius litorisediminis]|uniref:Haloacetate dehalogenase H-1 n=2 Tax=Roseovarius litorisediminis TaxID=1312363 RepID=A0A1Y5TTD2_9RHOB|nr:Haloacetate dehalogenase H-1 [Roseovarius litorisediminis]
MQHARNIESEISAHGLSAVKSEMIEMDTGRIRIYFQGEGTPLVFLHSAACDNRQWRDISLNWSHHHQVVMPDLPGCGASDGFEADKWLTLENEANAIIAVADHLQQPFHLIGHSYGGAVALKSAMQLGPKLASLTLIEPTSFHLLGHGDRFEKAMLGQIDRFAASIEQAVMSGFDETAMMQFVDFWSGPGSWDKVPAAKRAALLPRAHKLPGDFGRLFNEDLRPADIAKLTVPTLVICGTQSPEPVRVLSRLIAKSIIHSRHRTIGWAGHMLPLTHRAQVNVLLEEHFALSKAALAA